MAWFVLVLGGGPPVYDRRQPKKGFNTRAEAEEWAENNVNALWRLTELKD